MNDTTSDRLNQIRFVLINTSHAGNIGATARAMKVMGLSDLHLVQPSDYPSAEATARASGADDVLYHAAVHTDLDRAIAPCTLVLGTSARNRGMDIPVIDLREAVEKLIAAATTGGSVALLFGKERYGMTNEEMQKCHYLVKFPANPEYSSLNLAAAVQVAAYEIRQQWLAATPAKDRQAVGANETTQFVDAARMRSYYEHLFKVMHDVGFMHEHNQRSLTEKLHMMFNRMHIEKHEMDILRGFLSAITKKITK